jgi:hypothetical protein
MKSYKLKIALIAFVTLWLGSCERELDTEGVTKRITYYPVFELEGDEEISVTPGDAFVLPTAIAREQGAEIPVTTTITGTYFVGSVDAIDTSVPDIYNVTYSATNVDGYSGSASRTVTVLPPPTGDLVTSLEGTYLATSLRTPAAAGNYVDMEYVYIIKTGDNTFQISDIIGGYYDLGRGFGPGYAGTGATITANDIPGNDFTFSDPIGVGVFGGSAEITSMEVNAGAKTIKFNVSWDAGPYTFEITLKQV